MAVRRLDNAVWGFDTNCFVCDPHNELGLRIPFFHDDQLDVVTADFRLDSSYSGPPTYVHGGVTLAVLDEAMAWAVIAVAGVFAVTRSTRAWFSRPVRVDERYRVEARLGDRPSDGVDATAVVLDMDGRRCARARARFAVVDAELVAPSSPG